MRNFWLLYADQFRQGTKSDCSSLNCLMVLNWLKFKYSSLISLWIRLLNHHTNPNSAIYSILLYCLFFTKMFLSISSQGDHFNFNPSNVILSPCPRLYQAVTHQPAVEFWKIPFKMLYNSKCTISNATVWLPHRLRNAPTLQASKAGHPWSPKGMCLNPGSF